MFASRFPHGMIFPSTNFPFFWQILDVEAKISQIKMVYSLASIRSISTIIIQLYETRIGSIISSINTSLVRTSSNMRMWSSRFATCYCPLLKLFQVNTLLYVSKSININSCKVSLNKGAIESNLLITSFSHLDFWACWNPILWSNFSPRMIP